MRFIRKLCWGVFTVVVLLLFVVGAFGWSVVKTQWGANWLFVRVAPVWLEHTGQSFQVNGVSGNLWDGLSIQSLVWSRGAQKVQFEQAFLEVSWWALRDRWLRVDRFAVGSVRILSVSSKGQPMEPAEMPNAIELPLRVSLEQLEVQELMLNNIAFEGVQASATVTDGLLELEGFGFRFDQASVALEGSMLLRPPFKMQGELNFQKEVSPVLEQMVAQAAFVGDLTQLDVTLNALGRGLGADAPEQSLVARAKLNPLSLGKIEQASVQASRFNPSQWFDAAPQADLSLDITLLPNAPLTRSQGHIRLVNEDVGLWGDQHLPIALFEADYSISTLGETDLALELQIQTLDLDTGQAPAGRLKGRVLWASGDEAIDVISGLNSGNWQADLQFDELDVKPFLSLQQSTRAGGVMQVSATNGVVRIRRFELSDRKGQLMLSGALDLTEKMPGLLKASFKEVNPASYALVDGPKPAEGRLSGDLTWSGMLGEFVPEFSFSPSGAVKFSLKDSVLAGLPFVLEGEAQGNLKRARRVQFNLGIEQNVARVQGAYGSPDDSLSVFVKAPNLDAVGEALGLPFEGALDLDATVVDLGGEAQAQVQLQARALKFFDQLSVDNLQGDLVLGLEANSVWEGQVGFQNLVFSGATPCRITEGELQLSGTQANHTVSITLETAYRPFKRRRAIGAQLQLSGGLLGKPQKLNWEGGVQKLVIEGLWRPVGRISLLKPAPLSFSDGALELGQLELISERDGTSVTSEWVRVSQQGIELQGQSKGVGLPKLRRLLGRPVTLEVDDLVVALDWSLLSNSDQFKGHVGLKQVSGGFSLLEEAEIPVPVNSFDIMANFDRERIALDANLDATGAGVVTAQLTLPVTKSASTDRWMVAGNSPMQGALAAGLTDLSWLGPLLSPGLRTKGEGQVALAIEGTPNSPRLQGRLFARQFNVFELNEGLRLEDGNLVVDFNNDRAKLEDLQFTVYHRQAPRGQLEQLGALIQGTGKVTGAGQWNLNGLDGRLGFTLDRVGLIQRPDRWWMVSADLEVLQPSRSGMPIQIGGRLETHGAYIEMPEGQPETLGSDVVIKGQVETEAGRAPVDVQLQANLGSLFFVDAEGLSARLEGGVELAVQEAFAGTGIAPSRRLRAEGQIRTAGGLYRAYGQNLTIERGVVSFQGPLDNPGLNVRAVRKGVAVEAGVEITGTALRPQVNLVSDPPVPDPEKLSWMILGRGSNSSDRDATLLLTAAAALFGDGANSQVQQLAGTLGIDDFALSSGSLTAADGRAAGSLVAVSPGADVSASVLGEEDPLLTQRLITLGKRLSDRLYLNFDQSVTTGANVFKLTYQHSRHLSFAARGGADNAVDAIYQFSFD